MAPTNDMQRSTMNGAAADAPVETLRNAEKYPHLVKYADPVQRPAREILGREAELKQVMASLNRPELSNVLLLAPPGSGKALPLDTPIPTPAGWTTMGELKPGQVVLGRNGKRTKVTFVTDVQHDLKMYDLQFSDGTSQIACKDHRWVVEVDDKAEAVYTTEQLLAHLGDGKCLSIRRAYDIGGYSKKVAVDPYVLGLWLGAGRTKMGAQGDLVLDPQRKDIHSIIATVEANGFDFIGDYEQSKNRRRYGFKGLGEALQRIGIDMHSREIPMRYLRGSREQRLEVLRGISDTMGKYEDNGRLVFSSTAHDKLLDSIYELARTLGMPVKKSSYSKGDAVLYMVTISVDEGMSEFYGTQLIESIDITAIEYVGTMDGKCIQVDAEDSVYLCGKDFLPTHNTALVQAAKMFDTDRIYIEIDLSRMIANLNNENEMAARLKALFDEAERYSKQEGRELVLFMDEFHQVVQLSAAAVEALKPVLAASGTRGILVIAATTFEEYHQYIAPNQPLDERLQRIDLTPANREMTIGILKGMAARYGVDDQFRDDHLFELMYEWTNRYIPRSTQPRKSIRLLDAMIGWHRYTGEKMTEDLLARMLQQMTGINLAFSVNGDTIKQRLDERVYSQDAATSVIARRLQLAVADLNDKSRPMFSALFTGSTGVGKANTCSTTMPVYSNDAGVSTKTMGEIEVGDYVFDRSGAPTQVTGVYPQGELDVYRVTFTDGRTLDVNDEHLWTVYTARQRSKKHKGIDVTPMTLTTREMIDRGVVRTYPGDNREHLKFFIPVNGAVRWPAQDLDVDPYVLGVLIGNGALRESALSFSSDDEYTVAKIADAYGTSYKKYNDDGYTWVFPVEVRAGKTDKLLQTRDVLKGEASGLINLYSRQRYIPEKYLHASIEQRWALVRGLFDTDGTIGASNDRFNVSYSTFSERLANDVQELLYSLGVSCSQKVWRRTKVDESGRERELVEHHVHVKCGNDEKINFFELPRKRDIVKRAAKETAYRERVKKFDMLGIKSIEPLGYKEPMQCIMVDNDEHLYQAGQFVVTHNTEMTKQLADILFGDDTNRMIRFDMTEFALEDSLPVFKTELTQKVSDMGHAVILFDEIEKANPVITRLLLQILDDGRMRDDHGRQVSFLNCYIIITTNAGSEVYKTIGRYASDDQGSAEAMRDYEKVIRASIQSVSSGFPPELLGRLDAIVPFQPLSRNTQEKIIKGKLRKLRDEVYKRHGVKVRFDPRVLTYITQDKVDVETDAGGARAAVRILNDEVATEIAMFLNRYHGVRTLQVSVQGTMRNEDKHVLKSGAKIVVREAIGAEDNV